MSEKHFQAKITVGLLIENDGKILYQKRKNTGYEDGKYGLPGGHLEANESLVQAITREIKEEIGVTIHEDNLKLISVLHKKESGDYVNFFFATKEYEGIIENKEPDKCEELRWFPVSEVPSTCVYKTDEVIKNYNNGNILSEFGWNNEK